MLILVFSYIRFVIRFNAKSIWSLNIHVIVKHIYFRSSMAVSLLLLEDTIYNAVHVPSFILSYISIAYECVSISSYANVIQSVSPSDMLICQSVIYQ